MKTRLVAFLGVTRARVASRGGGPGEGRVGHGRSSASHRDGAARGARGARGRVGLQRSAVARLLAPRAARGDRKRELARYLHNLRQRLVRLAVLAEWAPVQRRAQISILCGDMLGQLRQHDRAFVDGADRLFGLHSQMAWARAPLFDLPGALDVLCNGKYSALPASITDVAPKPPRGEDEPEDLDETAERLKLQRRIELEIRGRILEEASTGTPSRGDARLEHPRRRRHRRRPGEYRATLALGGPPPSLRPRPSRRTERTPPAPPPPPPPAAPTAGGSSSASRSSRANESGARTASTSRAPSPSRNSKTVCSASAPPRAWRGCPPTPAPPERVEGGAQGLSGVTLRVPRRGVAFSGGDHHGTVQTRGARGRGVAQRRHPNGAHRGAPGEGARTGTGEGIRSYFWLPGAASAAGTRRDQARRGGRRQRRGEDHRAAVDAAVAAGTLPRVELTYARAVDDDSASGRIRAEALLPRPKTRPGSIASRFPLDMAAVDIREVLADGVRAAAKVHLEEPSRR